ncbi:UNVERIFIED_CONTAM: hypothetical protein PYX00_002269 [Menopon gallinae]|uniref:Bms1-type G domain-containing protein n=1 Tax=Menopon gallinae TaxID=328185 RepID=A0AAW2IG77_9NEOP
MPDDSAENVLDKKKPHRERTTGRKAEKKKLKKGQSQDVEKKNNPKAFAIKSAVQAERRFRRKQDLETKKQHIPVVDRNPVLPPPLLVAVVGPPKVGKSTVIRNLIKHFTKQPLSSIQGPVTLTTGKRQRMTIIECNNDINSMIDLAKVADLVLLLVDASFGFEMEIFEFLNICQVHGMPRILGVLTHLDLLKNSKQLKKTKKTLKHRFWTEVYPGAKLFYLSGIIHGDYLKNDIRNLGRFISIIKLRPLVWRSTHPYVLVDRLEDITDPEELRKNSKCDRNVYLYGYVRGIPLTKKNNVHLPGCGDYRISSINHIPDPCPFPEKKKRSLIEKDKTIYAPFSGAGGIVFDKDAVYVELTGSANINNQESKTESADLVSSIITTRDGLDMKMEKSQLKIFSDSTPIVSSEFKDISNPEKASEDLRKQESDDSSDEEDNGENAPPNYFVENVEEDGRIRRKVVFAEKDCEGSDSSGDDEGESDGDLNDGEDDDEEDSDANTDEENEVETTKPQPTGEQRVKKDEKADYIKTKISDVLKKLEQREVSMKKDNQKPIAEKIDEDDVDEDDNEDDEDDDDDDDDDDDVSETEGKSNKRKLPESDSNEDGKRIKINENLEEDDFDSSAVKWKEKLAEKALSAFVERQNNTQNLYKLVYGNYKRMLNKDTVEDEDEDAPKIGGIFSVVNEKVREKTLDKDLLDEYDTSIFPVHVRDWTNPELKLSIKDCFVTGAWNKLEDAEELLKLDDMSDEDGDFEDLETGEKHEKKQEDTEKAKLLERKKKLKEKFDAEYDEKEEYSYYDDLKAQVDQQAQLNKSEFEGLAEDVRIELEGYRAGMYVRIELNKMPCELIEYFDPTFPLIIGGLLPIEENIGFVQVRMKKHRWYGKILKTKDPLIVSLGWRRFQTIPVYSKLEDNMRLRYLKYTPQHVSCMAHMYGPITPQGTGFLAVQNVAVRTPGFRIACTGSVVEIDKSTTITKKLKLVGTPMKIIKKTAFIQGMFNSILEVGKFEGAKIRTVSGVRGQIKKAISKPEGAFRATFEDKIKMSDIVFCRTWYPVEVPKFYNPVTTLLLTPERKASWEGMRTLGELKREMNIKNEAQKDSLYIPITRKEKKFKELQIPKTLQKSLPFKMKPKNPSRHQSNFGANRIAVVREPYEEKVSKLLKMVKTNFEHKKETEKLAMIDRVNKHKQLVRAEEAKKMKRQKEVKKQVFRALSRLDKSKKKHFK